MSSLQRESQLSRQEHKRHILEFIDASRDNGRHVASFPDWALDDEDIALAVLRKNIENYSELSCRLRQSRMIAMKLIEYYGVDEAMCNLYHMRRDRSFMIVAISAYGHRVMRYVDPSLLNDDVFRDFISCLPDIVDIKENLCLEHRTCVKMFKELNDKEISFEDYSVS